TVLTFVDPLQSAAQLPFPTTTIEPFPTTPETEAPAPPVTPLRTVPTTTPSPAAESTTSSELRRASSTTTSESTTSTVVTIAPAPGAPGVAETTAPDRTRPGEGDMPAWPVWLFGLGAGATGPMRA